MWSYPTERKPLDEYIVLGDTGLKVARLTLGAMNFGDAWKGFMGECPQEEAREIFRTYVNAGGNIIDTADIYQNGQSEEWIGQFIKELEEENQGFSREDLVIATKYTINTKKGSSNFGGNNRKNMIASVKASLERLQTDYVDIFYLHVWDHTTSPREVMRGLNDLVSSGLVRYLGISDTPAWRVVQMNMIAEQYGWAKFSIYQGKYNIGLRTLEYDILDSCREFKMGITPWAILGGGKFTGRIKRGDESGGDLARKSTTMNEKEFEILDVILEVAKEQNEALGKTDEDEDKVTPSQITLAWALEQPGFTTMLVGGRKVSHITDNIRALSIQLSEDQLKRLNDVSTDPGYFPYTMIGRDMFGVSVAKAGGRYTPSDWTRTQSAAKFNTEQ